MGKTSQKLVIHVYPPWMEHPEIQALIEKGHEIQPLDLGADLYLHPNARRFVDEYFGTKTYLSSALTETRRYKKKSKT